MKFLKLIPLVFMWWVGKLISEIGFSSWWWWLGFAWDIVWVYILFPEDVGRADEE